MTPKFAFALLQGHDLSKSLLFLLPATPFYEDMCRPYQRRVTRTLGLRPLAPYVGACNYIAGSTP